MYELSITKIKYPKNDTIIYICDDYNILCKNLKDLLENKKITKNDIIRIEVKQCYELY